MFHHTTFQKIRKRWKIILLLGIVGALLVPGITWLLPIPLEYRADTQVLIIAATRYGVDPYTAAKSAERIGENLSQVVETSDFYNKVFALSGVTLDQSEYQNISENKRRKRWQNNVDASVVFGTSVVTMSAYHESATEARNLSGALAQAMLTHARDYVGGDIEMRIINQPIVTEYPVRPNLIVQAVLGAVIGGLLALALILS